MGPEPIADAREPPGCLEVGGGARRPQFGGLRGARKILPVCVELILDSALSLRLRQVLGLGAGRPEERPCENQDSAHVGQILAFVRSITICRSSTTRRSF